MLFTNVVKLRDFLFCLLHNKIFYHDILVHWWLVDSPMCDLCNQVKQTIVHLMFNFMKVRPIWNKIGAITWRAQLDCNFSPLNIILNRVHEDVIHVCNTITLIVKQYIYRCMCEKLILHCRIEMHNAKWTGRLQCASKKWEVVIFPFKLANSLEDLLKTV